MTLPLLALCGSFLLTYNSYLFLENIFSNTLPLLISAWGIFYLILYTYHFAITLAFYVYDSEAKKKSFRHITVWILVVYRASLFFKSNIFSLITFTAIIFAIGAAVFPSFLFQKGFPERWKEFLLLLWGWTVLMFSAEIYIVFLTKLMIFLKHKYFLYHFPALSFPTRSFYDKKNLN